MTDTVPGITLPFKAIRTRLPEGMRDRISAQIPPGGKKGVYELFIADGRLAREIMTVFTLYIAPTIERQYAERVYVWPQISTARHNTPDATDFHRWHTDAGFFDLLASRGTTVWLPFDDVGRDAPSLEFTVGGRVVTPALTPGAALAFGMDIPHRTQTIAGTRISIDLRMAPISRLTPEVDAAARFHIDVQDGAVGFSYVASDHAWEQFVPVPGAIDPLAAATTSQGPSQ